MLERLLDPLRKGGTWSVGDLAEVLDTTPKMVEAMLEDLARRGFLRPLAGGCERVCGTCPFGEGCVVGRSGRVWRLDASR